MVYGAAVQILKQAEDLKCNVLRKCDLLNDSQAWTDQQKLQNVYQQVLILDLEYALDKKVEQDLWNIGFKTYITTLQELIRDKKNPRRSDCQALLTWCLEEASGFYLSLLQELCDIFDLDLPFRRNEHLYGLEKIGRHGVNLPQSSSCLYICQYCLVHLGDIARYRNQRRQAESFYKQAILVSPTSGHPYNQLALLEASRGDKLSTVFYYIRGIAVKNPFPASTTNLLSTLNSTLDKESSFDRIKITTTEFIQIFLGTHALLHTATDLHKAKFGIQSLNTAMTALVATQSFTTDKLIKMLTINLYTYYFSNDGTELTECEKIVKEYSLDLLAGSLSALLIPVHTLKCDETLLDYYALPAIKLLINLIENEPNILMENVFANRLQIWPSLCKLLNGTQQYIKDFDYSKYATTPLLEDRFLQGFKPLQKTFKQLDFKGEKIDEKVEKMIRIKRIINFGEYLANSFKLISIRKGDEIVFEPQCIQPDPTNELLEEMKFFNVSDQPKINERKGGILKPQGSLEKSREERELFSDFSDINNAASSTANKKDKMKRPTQNVALQSIFKKIEENKQVKFNVAENEKQISTPSTSQFNLTTRPQTYNQNIGNFSNQSDYMFRNYPHQEFPLKNEREMNSSMILPSPYQSLFNSSNQRLLPLQSAALPPPLPNYQNLQYQQQLPPNKIEDTSWWSMNNLNQQADFSSNYLGNLSTFSSDFNKSNQASGDRLRWGNYMENIKDGRQNIHKENVTQHDTINPQSYSLFNTNTWTPNFMGQLRQGSQENNMVHMPQHSLFTGQGPQSLAQLLEQQQLQKK